MIALLIAVIYVGSPESWLDYGVPSQSDVIAFREGYVVGFNDKTHNPDWTMHRITAERLRNPKINRIDDFRHDSQIPRSAELGDYKGSGWARGHMVPAADMKWSRQAMSETFLLSNIIPQETNNNSGPWQDVENTVRRLALIEKKVRGWAIKEKSLWVITGPIYDKDKPRRTIGKTGVRIPDAIFKVVLDETPPKKMIAFIVPNVDTDGQPSEHVVTVDEVERRTGFDFFSKMLIVEQWRLESSSIYGQW